MIQSIFLVNQFGDIFLERHWKRVIVRNVLDSFFEAQNKVNSPDDISPVIASGPYYLIHIYKYGIYFIAVVQGEAPPLFVIEFLHRVTNIITDYMQVRVAITIIIINDSIALYIYCSCMR